jgi:hypothetical protein
MHSSHALQISVATIIVPRIIYCSGGIFCVNRLTKEIIAYEFAVNAQVVCHIAHSVSKRLKYCISNKKKECLALLGRLQNCFPESDKGQNNQMKFIFRH